MQIINRSKRILEQKTTLYIIQHINGAWCVVYYSLLWFVCVWRSTFKQLRACVRLLVRVCVCVSVCLSSELLNAEIKRSTATQTHRDTGRENLLARTLGAADSVRSLFASCTNKTEHFSLFLFLPPSLRVHWPGFGKSNIPARIEQHCCSFVAAVFLQTRQTRAQQINSFQCGLELICSYCTIKRKRCKRPEQTRRVFVTGISFNRLNRDHAIRPTQL